jgi:hypothetical protein
VPKIAYLEHVQFHFILGSMSGKTAGSLLCVYVYTLWFVRAQATNANGDPPVETYAYQHITASFVSVKMTDRIH